MSTQYPRFKPYRFDFEKTYIVPPELTGRLDLVSAQVYGSTNMYRPIAAFNHIIPTMGTRTGIRPFEESVRNELYLDGLRGEALITAVAEALQEHRTNDYDWFYYTDVSYGYMFPINSGDILYLPTFQSADEWMRQYEMINPDLSK